MVWVCGAVGLMTRRSGQIVCLRFVLLMGGVESSRVLSTMADGGVASRMPQMLFVRGGVWQGGVLFLV